MNTEQEINQKYGEIAECKAYLKETDYEEIKAYETGYEVSAEVSQKRIEARERINVLEGEIAELEIQLQDEQNNMQDENNGIIIE